MQTDRVDRPSDVFGDEIVAAVHDRRASSALDQSERASGREAYPYFGVLPGGDGQRDDIVQKCSVCAHGIGRLLKFNDSLGGQHRGERAEDIGCRANLQHAAFGFGMGSPGAVA